jgi:hypothetical protein
MCVLFDFFSKLTDGGGGVNIHSQSQSDEESGEEANNFDEATDIFGKLLSVLSPTL